ncbi:hypothetical protein [Streptomyces violascens]|uniref:Uncharacterized protein n=1 Tax=Streptomyces violascens TaxID=67381 RepID=A0ABQ3QXF0_9ACTN|nr:hypothetical protein [Streptomyces violascens]GGU13041.1 hypothetical protein GCM10010289_38340 [Streptomyces violascens]GHI41884.1 hypothetical protein Sviol_62920 [Streptomyces violascens]
MFEYTDVYGRRLAISPDVDASGAPVLCLSVSTGRAVLTVQVAAGRTEEVVAGIRGTVRQPGAAAAGSAS